MDRYTDHGPNGLSCDEAGNVMRRYAGEAVAKHASKGFAQRLYPHGLEMIALLRTLGLPVVLSDGDVVFQPRKIQRSGIWDAVEGRVLIYLHKERMLDAMQRRFPASHYVMIDDKPLFLAAMKRVMRHRMTTIFVRQGHYAIESKGISINPAPDMTVEHIGVLRALSLSDLRASTAAPAV